MKVTINCNVACDRIIFQVDTEIKEVERPLGFLSMIFGSGLSVAKAKAARVSMIRLIHNSWTAVSTDVSSLDATDETNVKITAVILTIN